MYNRPSIAIAVAMLAIAGAVFLFGTEKKYEWWEHYRYDSKDPYGTFIIQNLLKDYFPGKSFDIHQGYGVEEQLNSHTGIYLYIGSYFSPGPDELEAILEFVGRGNEAFIASCGLPAELLDSIGRGECVYLSVPDDTLEEAGEDDNETDTTAVDADFYFLQKEEARLNFEHPSLTDSLGYAVEFLQWNEPEIYTWDYLPPPYFCANQSIFISLGTLDTGLVNFTKARYGAGTIYLHTTPLAFTNLSLLEKRGLEYAGKVFSHLSPAAVLWHDSSYSNEASPRAERRWGKGPLQYILSQRSLAWAWYLLLALTLLYLIFGAKRRQRIIPVLPCNTNTSLEFIGVIGRLHFLQHNHKQLALKKMKLFLGFVRGRYHLPTKDLDEQFVLGLVAKSEVDKTLIDKILLLYGNISRSAYVSENTLIDFHRLLDVFYKKCR